MREVRLPNGYTLIEGKTYYYLGLISSGKKVMRHKSYVIEFLNSPEKIILSNPGKCPLIKLVVVFTNDDDFYITYKGYETCNDRRISILSVDSFSKSELTIDPVFHAHRITTAARLTYLCQYLYENLDLFSKEWDLIFNRKILENKLYFDKKISQAKKWLLKLNLEETELDENVYYYREYSVNRCGNISPKFWWIFRGKSKYEIQIVKVLRKGPDMTSFMKPLDKLIREEEYTCTLITSDECKILPIMSNKLYKSRTELVIDNNSGIFKLIDSLTNRSEYYEELLIKQRDSLRKKLPSEKP